MSNPLNIFIAYDHEDVKYLDELWIFLRPVEKYQNVGIWSDANIYPGTVRKQAIKDNMNKASIILLLISASSLASDYFLDVIVEDALELRKNATIEVVPFIVRPCLWRLTPLSELQPLPRDGKALSYWKEDTDSVYYNVANEISKMVNALNRGQL